MQLLEDIKEKMLTSGLLIDEKKEKTYQKSHGITIRRLQNGAKILGVQRITPDSRLSTVTFHIDSGGYFDPEGYRGAHHFLEHLFFTQKLRSLYHQNLIEANAYTSQEKIAFYNRGAFNAAVKDYGLSVVLDGTVKSLIHPETIDEPAVFEFSKDIILREIDEYLADYRRFMYDELYKLLLDSRNPYYNSTLGEYESVKKTTPRVVGEVLEKQISSQNIIATVFSEGEGEENEALVAYTQRLLEDFPRTHKVKKIPPELLSRTAKIPFGTTTTHTIPIPSSIASINFVWQMPLEYLSVDEIASRLYIPFMAELFNIEGRDKGLGYSLYFFSRYLFPNTLLVIASVLCPKEEIENTTARMEKVVATTLQRPSDDKHLFDEVLSMEKNRQMAEPISSGARIEVNFESIMRFDTLFNSEKLREMYLRLTTEDIKRIHSMLAKEKPAVFILGNL